jgi:hypothetical protein
VIAIVAKFSPEIRADLAKDSARWNAAAEGLAPKQKTGVDLYGDEPLLNAMGGDRDDAAAAVARLRDVHEMLRPRRFERDALGMSVGAKVYEDKVPNITLVLEPVCRADREQLVGERELRRQYLASENPHADVLAYPFAETGDLASNAYGDYVRLCTYVPHFEFERQ